tara:strand:- start:113 stop:1219 length:1107 start_codon:yes stop_codon:yes gene_type:complete
MIMSLKGINKKRFSFKIIFIQIIFTLILIVTIDLIANLFIERVGHKEFRLQRPEPYANASYFSRDFINEAFTQPGKWLLDEKYGGVKPNNYKGKWINVKNNRRVTINEQKDYLGTIYLFGGSTVYNGEVPDNLTIASQLAALGANDQSYKVINMGATSVHSTQQLGRLKSEINLKNSDIVIFYDGVNDVLQRNIYENSGGFMIGQPKKESFWIEFLRSKSKYSSILYIVYSRMTKNTRETSSTLINNSIDDYINTLIETNKYVKQRGANFYHFLQPTIFTKNKLNEYEQMLIEKGEPFVPTFFVEPYKRSYPLIKSSLNNYNFSYSLTGIFDNLNESPFLDYHHVNHIGNKIISQNIWKRIKTKLKAD